jgi:hypothetical protein
MRGIEIKGRINVGLVLIRIRSVFGIPYRVKLFGKIFELPISYFSISRGTFRLTEICIT